MQIALVIWLSCAKSSAVRFLGQVIGKSRRYDGPMGKSDRAFVFGFMGLSVAIFGHLSSFVYGLMWLVVVLIAWTTVRRARAGLRVGFEQD